MEDLKPCPFCGGIPILPDGRGTQYDICCECGMAMSSIQICDLMTIEERTEDQFENFCYKKEYIDRAKAEAIKNWNTRH